MTIAFFESLGCKFVALNGKIEADPNWQNRPLSADEIAPWRGNIGVCCGQPSGGICWLDVDFAATTFLQRYPILLQSLIVYRANSNDHCKIAVRLADGGSYCIQIGNVKLLTLLGDGFHAAVIGTHPTGAAYQHNGRRPIFLSSMEFFAIWLEWGSMLRRARAN